MKSDRNGIKENGTGSGKLLAMDTATTSMSVALLEDGKVRKEISSLAERNHSIYLVTTVQDALAELGWSPKELDGLAVGRGPGSYTGVRIGVTVAKTMAWALRLPVAGVSSLEAMAGGGSVRWDGEARYADGSGGGPVWIVPMMNARRGQVFTALFGREADPEGAEAVYGTGWSRLREDGIRLMELWAEQLLEELRQTERRPAAVLFTGETEDFAAVIERFALEAEGLGSPGVRTAVLPYGIQAQYIGYLGAQRLAAGDPDDVHGLLPNYTQLPEAEVKLLAKKKQQ